MNNESLSIGSRISILTIAFLGWFFGGMQIDMTNLIRNANKFLITESGWSANLNAEQLNNLLINGGPSNNAVSFLALQPGDIWKTR